jgi:Uma2 family endonuclease
MASAVPKARMTVDEFLVWAEGRPGRYELEAGEVVAMAPERTRHLVAKGDAYLALRRSVERARVPCFALPDGATVRIDRHTSFEPDALVYCGPRLPDDAIEVPEPVIVVEILSPSTAHRDIGAKLAGYFRLPSVRHYLIVDPDRRLLIHQARGEGDLLATRIVSEGPLVLRPPGIELDMGELFATA